MTADVVVIGGGIYGCATAWRLAQRGLDVVVLEAGTIACGASGGEGERGVRANGRDPRELPLIAPAYAMWSRLAETLGPAIGYRQIGHLELIEREGDLVSAGDRVARQRLHDIPSHLLDARDVKRIEPEVSDSIIGAVHCPIDGVVDHTKTTRALAQAARECGARVFENTSALSLAVTGDRVATVCTSGGELAVNRGVVVACNAGVADLLATVDAVVPVFPVAPQVVITGPAPPGVVRHLIGHAHRRLALKALPDNRLMITGGRLGSWDAETRRGRVIDDQVAGNVAEAVAVFPRLSGIPVALASADRVEAIAPDMVPIIDRIPGTSNALLATGWSGHGWAIAPAVADLVVEWLLADDRPPLLAPFGLDRF